MPDTLSLTLAQLNPVVGDIAGNTQKILDVWKKSDADMVVFAEMVICGYPPEDLVLKPGFVKTIHEHIDELLAASKDFKAAALISCPWQIDGDVYNAVHVIEGGKIIHTQTKHHLPNYGVFDEYRIFKSGPLPDAFEFKGRKLGILICEDMWYPNVAEHLKKQGAKAFIVPNGSPFETTKDETRFDIARDRVKETELPLIYVNQVGGQDELVFDGASFIMDPHGKILFQGPEFIEGTYDVTYAFDDDSVSGDASVENLSGDAELYGALKLGLKDYIEKNGFPGLVLGLSGGIDSALAATIAVDALDPERVQCVMMPSPYTSQDSLDDAQALAENLGCAYEIIPIEKAMTAFEGTIEDLSGVGHENMQSRVRGLILMALSNMSGKMVLSNGNKSEMAVGYATLYGDMCGGFNVIKDLYKMQVYALARWRNKLSPVIPERILTKAPTAELKDNQTDQDSLPPYDVLDGILECLIEEDLSVADIVSRGFEKDTVLRVWQMLDRAEYKRRQSPPGVKITARNFGRDRRYPITNHYLKSI
ncbi:MAG: NAD+ synthase [Alphaproteobacteria bacterium]|nr:NAD+ synthase [Alphaproteobacteria bacterium]